MARKLYTNKTFRDPVHGYIEIPSKWCDIFIDTFIFQRLRQIEQTSMRVLYPGARHDRFIHSLGVYHLGKYASDCLCRNSQKIGIKASLMEKCSTTFQIACLLHDCGHSPFSHTLEKYYDSKNKELANDLANELSSEFKQDFISVTCAPHETVSAYLVATYYKDRILELGYTKEDIEFIARCIVGCPYTGIASKEDQIRNIWISLLNGFSIDVDKLDYILRDTWASGVQNSSVDTKRLLSSLSILENGNNYKLAFRSNALSVLQNAVEARNFLYRWIYTHHKVLYEVYLLQKAVEKAINDECFNEDFFKLSSFKSPQGMLNDSDIISILKNNISRNTYAEEILSRNHKLYPLWKNYVEFKSLIGQTEERIKRINIKAESVASSIRESLNLDDSDFVILKSETKLSCLTEDEILIDLGNGSTEKYPFTERKKAITFFFAYLSKDKRNLEKKVIEKINSYSI